MSTHFFSHSDAPRILIIRFRFIGDVLLVTPLLQNLRRQFPQAHLALLTDAEAAPVVKNHPALDELLVFRAPKTAGRAARLAHIAKLLWHIRRSRFDIAINLQPGTRGGIAAWFSDAPRRAGYARPGEKMWPYNVRVPYLPGERYRVEHMLDALRALGLETQSELPSMGLTEDERAKASHYFEDEECPVIVLHPGRPHTRKTWFDERFVQVIDGLSEKHGARVLIAGAPNEKERADNIAAQTKSKPRVVAGELSLSELGALIERADLFIGIDSGPMHIASAVGAPTVALFGFSNPREWNPPGPDHIAIQKQLPDHPCDPPRCCPTGDSPCMKNIEVREVLSAAEKLLSSRVKTNP